MGIMGSYGAGSAGEIVPVFKYNAIQGRAYKVEREQTADGWTSEDVEVPFPVKFVADFDSLEVGQMAFVANRPDFHMVRYADVESGDAAIPDRPTPEHRFGFRVRIFAEKALGGMREWRGQQKVVTSAMDALYEEWKADANGRPAGNLPVVAITGVQPVKRGGQYPGTDMVPIMKIEKYVPRPAGLTPPAADAAPAQAEQPAPFAGKAQPAGKHTPPPAKAAQLEEADDF